MMVKKYFALTLIAASLAVAGCSSSDDDDDGGTDTVGTGTSTAGTGTDTAGTGTDTAGTGTDTAGTGTGTVGTDGGEPDGPVEDMSTMTGTSILDLARGTEDEDGEVDVAGNAELTTLVTLLGEYPDLLNILDDEDAALTVFAPNNAAFEAAGEIDAADVKNILQYHVATQSIDATVGSALAEAGTPVAVANGGTVTITAAEGGELQVVDSEGNAVALGTAISASNGNANVYVIDSVLAASEATTGGTDGDGGDDSDGGDDGGADGGATTGGGADLAPAGTATRAIQDDADLGEFEAVLGQTSLGLSLQNANGADNDDFVVFAPTDGNLGDTSEAGPYMLRHIVNNGNAVDEDGLLQPGAYQTTGNTALTVGGTIEAPTVNGLPVIAVGVNLAGGSVFKLDGETQ